MEQRLGYEFRDAALLSEALTHSTYAEEHGCPSNQRLEFLGDAVLELCVSRRLFEREREIGEGVLTKWRALLVCERSLAACARELGLGECLRMSGSALTDGLRYKPSVLCDAMESVIAAVYLDGGLEAAAALVERILGAGMEHAPDVPDDYKSRLQMLLQEDGGSAPEYRLVSASGPDHQKVFEFECAFGDIVTRGVGASKKQAQQAAAREALALLGQRSGAQE
ncbi:MAG: ribonuclease III [Candidatus Fimadaptatus sp.]